MRLLLLLTLLSFQTEDFPEASQPVVQAKSPNDAVHEYMAR